MKFPHEPIDAEYRITINTVTLVFSGTPVRYMPLLELNSIAERPFMVDNVGAFPHTVLKW